MKFKREIGISTELRRSVDVAANANTDTTVVDYAAKTFSGWGPVCHTCGLNEFAAIEKWPRDSPYGSRETPDTPTVPLCGAFIGEDMRRKTVQHHFDTVL